MTGRPYRQTQRAAQQQETRQRIVEATAALHEEIGPAATTISAIAERAGVQRLTVYRHFADESALFEACAAHTLALHPPPDLAGWASIQDPEERLRTALGELYAYYAGRGDALAKLLRDAETLPALRETMAAFDQFLGSARDILAQGWPAEGERLRRASLGHALRHATWRSLAAEGLSVAEAGELMVRLVADSALWRPR